MDSYEGHRRKIKSAVEEGGKRRARRPAARWHGVRTQGRGWWHASGAVPAALPPRRSAGPARAQQGMAADLRGCVRAAVRGGQGTFREKSSSRHLQVPLHSTPHTAFPYHYSTHTTVHDCSCSTQTFKR